MNTTTPELRDLARRLIAIEAARDEPHGAGAGAAVLACETLRVPLAKLVGPAGYRSLLSRALAMAKAEVPSLGAALVRPDGTPEGLGGIGRAEDAEAGSVVLAHLIGLLATFIGEPLVLGLVRDAWPDAPAGLTDRRVEGPS